MSCVSKKTAADAQRVVTMKILMYWMMMMMTLVELVFGDSGLVWHAGNYVIYLT